MLVHLILGLVGHSRFRVVLRVDHLGLLRVLLSGVGGGGLILDDGLLLGGVSSNDWLILDLGFLLCGVSVSLGLRRLLVDVLGLGLDVGRLGSVVLVGVGRIRLLLVLGAIDVSDSGFLGLLLLHFLLASFLGVFFHFLLRLDFRNRSHHVLAFLDVGSGDRLRLFDLVILHVGVVDVGSDQDWFFGDIRLVVGVLRSGVLGVILGDIGSFGLALHVGCLGLVLHVGGGRLLVVVDL